MTSAAPALRPQPRLRRPGASRVRRVQEVQRGNVRAWKHGVFSIIGNQLDVMTEVALVFASHPLLDPIADRRLVELYATTNAQRQRCLKVLSRGNGDAVPVVTGPTAPIRLPSLASRLPGRAAEPRRTPIPPGRGRQMPPQPIAWRHSNP